MKKPFVLCLLFAFALLFSSCQFNGHSNSHLTQPPSGLLCGISGEDVSVYDHLETYSVHLYGTLEERDVDWFRQRLLLDVGIDITFEKASEFEIFDWEKSFACRFGDDVVYFRTCRDGQDPDSSQSFEECLEECKSQCIAGCGDPKDPNYGVCVELCDRDCRIKCASRKYGRGRFSRKPAP
ncbi:MAG: hypothetical protein ACE5JA_02115 [bacterium]